MLKKLLPPNSPLRNRLRYMARRANFAVTHRLRKRFSTPEPGGTKELRELLETIYLPSWHSGLDVAPYLSSIEGQQELLNHLTYRLEMDRYELIPWLDSVLPLRQARILEIGCGTGSATVALAEQGATVTALDLHAEGLLTAQKRCQIHGFLDVAFINGNAQDLGKRFSSGKFDMILFFAVLEHMTLGEREAALRAAWSLLEEGQYLVLGETPNRLWPYDSHTSELPFFNWLPDELALRYAPRSPRYTLRTRFREITEETMLSFRREGRGMSFHELDLALGGEYDVISDRVAYLTARNPLKLLKRLIARDATVERTLNGYAPNRHRGFFREYLDVIVRKEASRGPAAAHQTLRVG